MRHSAKQGDCARMQLPLAINATVPTGVTYPGRSQFSGTWNRGQFVTVRESKREREREGSFVGSCRLLDAIELQAMWQAHLPVA